jgi:hypothetical protein
MLLGPSNTRVQRTRSSASRRRSPLTRGPLGAGKLRCWLVCVCLLDAFWALGCHMGPSLEAYRAHLANGWRVSGERKRVRCTRLLGRLTVEPS